MADFTLAHVSDPHLATRLPRGAWLGLTLKQILALSSWRRRRAWLHREAALEMLRDDVSLAQASHLAVTGDLVNIAHPAEFGSARDWLATMGVPEHLAVVTGNHDHLRATASAAGLSLWGDYVRGDAGEAAPWLRRREGVALIGLQSGCPTPLGRAHGRLGRTQLAELGRMLRHAREEGLFRVVLLHHAPLDSPGGARKALRDRAALATILTREGAELVLHGHHHATLRRELPGPNGPIPVWGAPSASVWPQIPSPDRPKIYETAGWLLHRIETHPDHWRLTTTARRLDAEPRFVNAGRWECTIVRPVYDRVVA